MSTAAAAAQSGCAPFFVMVCCDGLWWFVVVCGGLPILSMELFCTFGWSSCFLWVSVVWLMVCVVFSTFGWPPRLFGFYTFD